MYITVNGKAEKLCEAELCAPPLSNAHGEAAFFPLPFELSSGDHFLITAILKTNLGLKAENEYELFIESAAKP